MFPLPRWLAWATALYVSVMLILFFGSATARADSWDCSPRSEKHVTEHGGFRADSMWHVAHGELPTCEPKSADRKGSHKDSRKNEDEKDSKSKFCRKHWFC
ncbi:hypothetical protein CUCO_69 [Mycobacterium phage Cuco]|uniref:Uncharacterized protein n=1 Tax=Mycobacterium phage Cuco TaxID=2922992 RepID=G1JUP4_9CAUD|nr:site-specific recombination directionality factor RDF [Mycobacterium phage Cuco]AEL17737.1 hypothetical protein CUCO_69 [Mycobacterium phage Cuco]AVR76649.1 hypothetical protein SEA_COOG_67 [Mycobacterium phage Coog]AVR77194.1 hypothetical protein SEA_MIDAS2_67 [Mycobacterium phage Midas2]